MRKYITKPNSKIDETFMLSMSIMIFYYFSLIFDEAFSITWLTIVLSLIMSISTQILMVILYYGKYYPSAVNFRLSKKVCAYDPVYAPFISQDIKGLYYDSLLKKAPKVIDDICKATLIPIDERKRFYDTVCNIWTEEGKEIPPFITEKWKRAVIEYKKYEIWND